MPASSSKKKRSRPTAAAVGPSSKDHLHTNSTSLKASENEDEDHHHNAHDGDSLQQYAQTGLFIATAAVTTLNCVQMSAMWTRMEKMIESFENRFNAAEFQVGGLGRKILDKVGGVPDAVGGGGGGGGGSRQF